MNGVIRASTIKPSSFKGLLLEDLIAYEGNIQWPSKKITCAVIVVTGQGVTTLVNFNVYYGKTKVLSTPSLAKATQRYENVHVHENTDSDTTGDSAGVKPVALLSASPD